VIVQKSAVGGARAAVALAATALLVAACGSGGGSSSSAVVQKGTTAQVAAAQKLNVRAVDFPKSWESVPNTGGPNVVRDAVTSCTAHAGNPTVVATTPNFIDQPSGVEVGSQALGFADPATASAVARAGHGPTSSRCLQTAVAKGFPANLPAGERFDGADVATFSPPVSGRNGFAQRFTVHITFKAPTGGQQSAKVYVDMIGFASGTDVVEAEFESPNDPPQSALERTTLTALLNRANAAG
jgi:hypothetical protein